MDEKETPQAPGPQPGYTHKQSLEQINFPSASDDQQSQKQQCGHTDKQNHEQMITVSTGPWPALDGGWGYWVAVAAFCVAFMLDGFENSYGLLLPHVIVTFGGHVAVASLCGGLITGVILGVGPLAALLSRKYGCRRVSFVGSIVASASVVMATLARRIEIFVLFYGLFAGFGMGLVYLPSITMINTYFDRKRGLFAGVVTSGSGIGLLVIAFLTDLLIGEYGWRGCYLVIAGILLNLCVCASLMRPIEDNFRFGSRQRRDSSSQVSSAENDSLKANGDGEDEVAGGGGHLTEANGFSWVASQPLLPSQKTSGDFHPDNRGLSSLARKSPLFPQFNSLQKLKHRSLEVNKAESESQNKLGAGSEHAVNGDKHYLSKSTYDPLDSECRDEAVSPIDSVCPPWRCNGDVHCPHDKATSPDHIPQPGTVVNGDTTRQLRTSEQSETSAGMIHYECENGSDKFSPTASESTTNSGPKHVLPQIILQRHLHPSHSHHHHLHKQQQQHLVLQPGEGGSCPSLQDTTDLESSAQPTFHKSDLLNILPECLGSMSSLSLRSVHTGSQMSLRARSSSATSYLHNTAGASYLALSLGSKHSLPGGLASENCATELSELEQEASEEDTSVVTSYRSCELFSILRFDLFCAGAFLIQMAAIIPTMFVPSYVSSTGLSASAAAMIVSILGVSNTAGRLAAGILSYLGLGTVRIYNGGTFLAGVACFLLPLCHTFPALVAFAVGHGFFIGFYPPLQSVILVEQLGLERLPSSFGILCVCKSIASVSGPFFAGSLYEWWRNYAVPFYFAGAVMMAANIVHCVMVFCPKHQDAKDQ